MIGQHIDVDNCSHPDIDVQRAIAAAVSGDVQLVRRRANVVGGQDDVAAGRNLGLGCRIHNDDIRGVVVEIGGQRQRAINDPDGTIVQANRGTGISRGNGDRPVAGRRQCFVARRARVQYHASRRGERDIISRRRDDLSTRGDINRARCVEADVVARHIGVDVETLSIQGHVTRCRRCRLANLNAACGVGDGDVAASRAHSVRGSNCRNVDVTAC